MGETSDGSLLALLSGFGPQPVYPGATNADDYLPPSTEPVPTGPQPEVIGDGGLPPLGPTLPPPPGDYPGAGGGPELPPADMDPYMPDPTQVYPWGVPQPIAK